MLLIGSIGAGTESRSYPPPFAAAPGGPVM
jgi:hypothetical protein